MRRAIDGYFSGSEHWGRWVRIAFYLDPELTEQVMRGWAELSDGAVACVYLDDAGKVVRSARFGTSKGDA